MSPRPLNLVEKILAHHLLGDSEIVPGNFVCVRVDWIMASEASWYSMYRTYKNLGSPGVFEKDRIWVAADHIVDPRINHLEKPKRLIQAAEDGVRELGITNYQPPNTTIMHTEFYREKVLPGMLVIGADSHTCSSGALGALAVGLGAADVVFPMVTGETFFQVPETVCIEFVGKPGLGISGKDVILAILGEFKRNTIAAGRVVEYIGEGLQYLSCDARFAISNMSTEFGAIAGVFLPDRQTSAFLQGRSNPQFQKGGDYFQPDPDATYAEKHVFDLSKVVSLMALYPSPDHVVTVEEKIGMALDGCFIGACTTTFEDLIIAALVLKQGLDQGHAVVPNKKRKVTPGSIQIIAKLRALGLLTYYEQAGFEVGAPGCSYCVGMGADQAGQDEVWLSSQNRNYKNRMGKGAMGNICSAATVAASSFSMTVTDPTPFLHQLDEAYLDSVRPYWTGDEIKLKSILYLEPKQAIATMPATAAYKEETSLLPRSISSKVQRFGDDIDTDQIIPIEKCGADTLELLGQGAFVYYRPTFVPKVAAGSAIIVAGRGFGSGSSREDAPKALKACGVQAVIAKSFAYIYSRNQANYALFGIIVTDERFYDLAQEDAQVTVMVPERKVVVAGQSFTFKLDVVEERLHAMGGIARRWNKFGKNIFRQLQREAAEHTTSCATGTQANDCGTAADW
ncbi:3-isopropylmalate dehydratase [Gongronella butleri]|nr:3-isopropylmalate dehydratase [Gongronella butleri]